MKIPEPIIEPITIMVQSKRRRLLTSSGEEGGEVPFGEVEVAMLGRIHHRERSVAEPQSTCRTESVN